MRGSHWASNRVASLLLPPPRPPHPPPPPPPLLTFLPSIPPPISPLYKREAARLFDRLLLLGLRPRETIPRAKRPLPLVAEQLRMYHFPGLSRAESTRSLTTSSLLHACPLKRTLSVQQRQQLWAGAMQRCSGALSTTRALCMTIIRGRAKGRAKGRRRARGEGAKG